MNSSINYFNKPKKFLYEDKLDKTNNQKLIEDWYFVRDDEI